MRRDTGTGPGTPISGTVQYCGFGMLFSGPDLTFQLVLDAT